MPEVRVASAVTEEGQSVYHNAVPANVGALQSSQYVPIRRAVPVNVGTMTEPHSFNVAEYLANDQDRPAFQPRTTRVYRLPNGTQEAVTN